MSIEEKLAALKEKKTQREQLDKEIASLSGELQSDLDKIAGSLVANVKRAGPGKGRGVRHCSLCGKAGHQSTTCPERGKKKTPAKAKAKKKS